MLINTLFQRFNYISGKNAFSANIYRKFIVIKPPEVYHIYY